MSSRIIKSFGDFINETPEYHVMGSLDHDYIRINIHKPFKKKISSDLEEIGTDQYIELGEIDGHVVYKIPFMFEVLLTISLSKDNLTDATTLFSSYNDKKYGQRYQVKITTREEDIDIKDWMLKSYQLLLKKSTKNPAWVMSDGIQSSHSKKKWESWLENPSKYGWKEVSAFYMNGSGRLRKLKSRDPKKLWIEVEEVSKKRKDKIRQVIIGARLK